MKTSAIILLVSLFFSFYANCEDEKTIKVAVIDTGYDFNSDWSKYDKIKDENGDKVIVKPKLCKEGHKDLTDTGFKDSHGHGTHVVGLIARYAKDANYCIIVVKAYSLHKIKNDDGTVETKTRYTKGGFQYAFNQEVDAVNYSSGGIHPYITEYRSVQKLLNDGVIIVAAAGNEGLEINHNILKITTRYEKIDDNRKKFSGYNIYFLNKKTHKITTKKDRDNFPKAYYPASYDPRIISVMNIDRKGKIIKSSNYGRSFTTKEMGTNVLSTLPNNKIGRLTGTSQATAIKTGKIINLWNID